jgi:hypothetical protein
VERVAFQNSKGTRVFSTDGMAPEHERGESGSRLVRVHPFQGSRLWRAGMCLKNHE